MPLIVSVNVMPGRQKRQCQVGISRERDIRLHATEGIKDEEESDDYLFIVG